MPLPERRTVNVEFTQLDGCGHADMIRLVAGRGAALNDLVEPHGEQLSQYLIHCSENEDDAADLSQETFVHVYQNCEAFDSRQRFAECLYAIASNLVQDCYHWRARHPQVSLDATIYDASDNLGEILPDKGLRRAKVFKGKNSLPPCAALFRNCWKSIPSPLSFRNMKNYRSQKLQKFPVARAMRLRPEFIVRNNDCCPN